MILKARVLVSNFMFSVYNVSSSVVSEFIIFVSVDWELRAKAANVSLPCTDFFHKVGISISQDLGHDLVLPS